METKKIHTIILKKILLSIFCLLSLGMIVNAQLSFTLSSDPLLVNDRLSVDGIVLQIQNNSNFVGDVFINIYSDRFQQKIVSKSRNLTIRELNHTFNLQEVFTNPNFEWTSEESTTVCFQIVSEKQNLPLGLSCSELIQVRRQKGNKIKNKKGKPNFFDTNITYELEALPKSSTPVNHILDYSGELRVKELPIKFQGFFQRNRDPYLDYDLSHFSSFIDVGKWRQKVKEKANKVYQKERDSLLIEFPDYRSYSKKKEYVDRVFNDSGTLEDLKAVDSLTALMEAFDIVSVDELPAYQDSLSQALIEQKNQLNEKKNTSLKHAERDSLERQLLILQGHIREVERLSKLALKKEAYDNLKNISSDGKEYLQKADSVSRGFDQDYQNILNRPNKLNQYLKHHKIGGKYMYLLNHVSEFRFGNINPGYSQLILQNSQIRGLSIGVEYGQWGIAGFRGNLTNSDLNIVPDSLSLRINVTGAKLSYSKSNKVKNTFFLVTAKEIKSFGERVNQSIVGHTSIYHLNKQNRMDFEIAWALDDTGISSELEESQAEKVIKALAAIYNYSGTTGNGKLNWNTEVEYYGPEYFDFNNPFLINNSIEFSNNIRYAVLKGFQVGLSTLYNKGDLWRTNISTRKQTISKGFNASFFHEKWPAVQYVFNNSKIDGANFTLHNYFQNLNISKKYSIKNTQLQSLLNTTFLENDSPLDSIDSRLITIYASQQIRLTEHLRVIAAFNYFKLNNLQSGRGLDLSYEIKMPINFDRLTIDPGLKWISNSNFEKLGWSMNVSWQILKDLSFNAFVNSLWLNGTIDEFGLINNEYTPHFSGRINYRF